MTEGVTPRSSRLRSDGLRRAMLWANINAGVWATGNGLVSTTLVFYLAVELGAAGIAASCVLAAPRFAGLLRLGVPALMARLKARKLLCILSYALSGVILCTVPLAAAFEGRAPAGIAIAVLVLAWCLYHLAEFCGTVALWSWLGDLMPARIRGRLIGRREAWLTGGRILGLGTSVALASLWKIVLPNAGKWQPLAISASIGAALMLIAVVPLIFMADPPRSASAVPRTPWRTLWRAFIDPAYRRLLIFNFWFSVANGITATAQELYPARVLNVSYEIRQLLQGGLRAGQLVIAPWMGRLVDAWGNRPVMVVSQAIVATGPLFYLAATPAHRWWIAGAFVVWIAYAGLNVGLDSIKLKLAPADNNAPYVAVYHAVGDLANGAMLVAGGVMYDWLTAKGAPAESRYFQLFAIGFVGRVLVVPLLVWLIEPGVRRVRDLSI
jgi:Na+/melibiose symporter-like transporter